MELAQRRRSGSAQVLTGSARLTHLIVVLACAGVGVGILAIVALAMVGPDEHSRDHAILALIITAPLWIFGAVAAVDAYTVLRGQPVSQLRGLLWAGTIAAGGLLLMAVGGHFLIVDALLSSRLSLVWPVLTMATEDGAGASYFYLDHAAFWLPVIAVVLGLAALVAELRSHRSAGTTPAAGRSVAGSAP